MLFHFFENKNTISPSEAYTNLQKDHSIVVLDVREEFEYKNGHIKGAKLLPVSQITSKMETMKLSQDTQLYVYCQSGGRSARACDILKKMGYEKVYNLGGIIHWPYEVTKK